MRSKCVKIPVFWGENVSKSWFCPQSSPQNHRLKNIDIPGFNAPKNYLNTSIDSLS